MPLSQLPTLLSAWMSDITAALDRRSAPRLLSLLLGALFAKGRRTVTSWFRAAGIATDFRCAYSALWAAGRRVDALSYRLLCMVLKPLMRLAGDGPLRFRPRRQALGEVYSCESSNSAYIPLNGAGHFGRIPHRPSRELQSATQG